MNKLEIQIVLEQMATVLQQVPVDPLTQHYYFDKDFLEEIRRRTNGYSLDDVDNMLCAISDFV